MSKEGSEVISKQERSVSGVLVGRYDHAMDGKKRFTIPREWRALMGEPDYIYVMPDPRERCLNLVPKAEMESRLEKLREKSLFGDAALNAALQTIGANSEQLPLDVQGRIRVCDRLLGFANISSAVALVGAVRMVKVWDPAALGPEDKIEKRQAALAKALETVGF